MLTPQSRQAGEHRRLQRLIATTPIRQLEIFQLKAVPLTAVMRAELFLMEIAGLRPARRQVPATPRLITIHSLTTMVRATTITRLITTLSPIIIHSRIIMAKAIIIARSGTTVSLGTTDKAITMVRFGITPSLGTTARAHTAVSAVLIVFARKQVERLILSTTARQISLK